MIGPYLHNIAEYWGTEDIDTDNFQCYHFYFKVTLNPMLQDYALQYVDIIKGNVTQSLDKQTEIMMSLGPSSDYVAVHLLGNIVVALKSDHCFRLMTEYNNLSTIAEYEHYLQG